MAKDIKNLRDELRSYKFDFDVLQKIPCTAQENEEYHKLLMDGGTLPEGVYAYVYANEEVSTKEFYTVYEADLSEAELQEYLTYKQLNLIKTIKNCVMFFTVLTIIGLAAYILVMLNI
ncbi:MAG: hypothetical protein IJA41_05760 [Clostridia bacterium]|nr:hypothetical protein [Clostridia bacterium]